MRFIVSPAKKMNVVDNSLPNRGLPLFLDRTQQLTAAIRALDYEQAKTLWQCSDALAELNFARFRTINLHSGALTPAVLAYEGIQYQHLAPHVMQSDQLEYVQTHLRILSGLYGVVRPFDGVVPYRLEMQAKLSAGGHENLYDFWGSSLYGALAKETNLIVNLASVEYAKAILPYAKQANDQEISQSEPPSQQNTRKEQPSSDLPNLGLNFTEGAPALQPRILTCLFGTLNNKGHLVQRSTAAKAARGSMVRWCAENKVSTPSELKEFNVAGYRFKPSLSSTDCFVFAQNISPKLEK